MSELRVGVIGVGHLGKHHARILEERRDHELPGLGGAPGGIAGGPQRPRVVDLGRVRLERLDCEQWNQPDHRLHLERDPRAAGRVQHVVEEPVGFVPHLIRVIADVIHR